MDKDIDQIVKELEAAKGKLDDATVSEKLAAAEEKIFNLEKEIKRRDGIIRDYQELNQKLYLKVSSPISNDPTNLEGKVSDDGDKEDEDPDLKSALAKIAESNKSNTEVNADGITNKQGDSSIS